MASRARAGDRARDRAGEDHTVEAARGLATPGTRGGSPTPPRPPALVAKRRAAAQWGRAHSPPPTRFPLPLPPSAPPPCPCSSLCFSGFLYYPPPTHTNTRHDPFAGGGGLDHQGRGAVPCTPPPSAPKLGGRSSRGSDRREGLGFRVLGLGLRGNPATEALIDGRGGALATQKGPVGRTHPWGR